MADFPVAATLVSDGARACEAFVAGVADGDTVSVTLPAAFVKSANPLLAKSVGPPIVPRYDLSVYAEDVAGGETVPAWSIVWSDTGPELVITFYITGVAAALGAYVLIKNLQSVLG